MMITIKCPKCSSESKMSLVDPDYTGPYKCWSCRAFFTMKVRGNVVESLEPLSETDYQAKYAKKADPLEGLKGTTRYSGPRSNF